MEKFRKRLLVIYVFILFITCVMAAAFFKYPCYTNFYYDFWGVYCFVICLINIGCLLKDNVKNNLLIIISEVIGYLFWNGQVLLKILGFSSQYYSSLEVYSYSQIIKGEVYTIFFLIFFQIGVILSRKIKIKKNIKVDNKDLIKKAINIIAVCFLLISIYPYFMVYSSMFTTSVKYGYASVYTNSSNINNWLYYLSNYFYVGLFLLFSNNRSLRKIILPVAIGIVIMFMIIGKRGKGLFFILGIIWIYIVDAKKVSFKKIITYLLIFMILINTASVVRNIRDSRGKNLNMVVESLKEENNVGKSLASTISEMGFTMTTLLDTMRIIPRAFPYQLGKSYYASIISIFPSSLIGGSEIVEKSNLSLWLTKYKHSSYGTGYSLVAETYYNFGWYAIIIQIILGVIYGYMLYYKEETDERNSINKIRCSIFFFVAASAVRGSIYLVVRDIFFMLVIPEVFIYLLYSCFSKHANKKDQNKLGDI